MILKKIQKGKEERLPSKILPLSEKNQLEKIK